MAKKERIEYLAMIAEIIGAFAVVVSVIYLAVQISDNTKTLKNQGHYNALSLAQRPLELVIADPDLADIIEKGYAAAENMSSGDWHRFSLYQVMAFNAWEFLYYANISESIPVNLWVGADAYYRDLAMTKPGLQRFWAEYKHIFDEPFHSYAAAFFQTSSLESGPSDPE